MRTSTIPLLVAPLLFTLAPRDERISFHPREGSKLAKQFTIEGKFEVGDVTFEAGGEDLSGEIPPDISGGFELLVEIADRYVKVKAGKPLVLERSFDHLKGEYHVLDESGSEDTAELEGKVLRFEWNDKEQRYDVSRLDGEKLPEELAFFSIDMDLRSLLPEKSVEQGDHWKVDGKALATALLPGIDLDKLSELEPDAEDAEAFEEFKSLLPQLEQLGNGLKTTCELTGARQVEGHELAVIHVELQCAGTFDLSEFIRTAIKEDGDLDPSDFDLKVATLSVQVHGGGDLLWDAVEGHAHGFDLKTELGCTAKVRASVTQEGEQADVSFDGEILGNCHWTMSLQ